MRKLFATTAIRTTMSLSLNKLQKRAPKSPETDEIPTKKSNRFDGVSEQEIMDKKSSLNDILDYDLDLVFVGINPSLMAAHTGRYYAGPGNHFYKLLYASDLITEPINHEEDSRLLEYKIGLTNIVARATRSSADLTRTELKKGAATVHEKLKTFKPKVAVFNGKCIYEEFADKYDKTSFRFGLQPHRVGDTALWVMPSSSARCANFPRMQDKLHFYTSLKKYLAYLKGEIEEIDLEELRFEGKCRQAVPSTSKMWRRKGISAFAYGGKIVNKETICMNTSDESLCIPQTGEFILKNVPKKEIKEGESDSGISASQSSVENFEDTSPSSSYDMVKQESFLGSEANETADRELSQGSKTESNASNEEDEPNDLKPKKIKQSVKRMSRSKLPSRTTNDNVKTVKERSETIDFMSLIKQRLSNKAEVTLDNDHEEDNCQDVSLSQSKASVKKLKYQNLHSDKLKRGFKIKKTK